MAADETYRLEAGSVKPPGAGQARPPAFPAGPSLPRTMHARDRSMGPHQDLRLAPAPRTVGQVGPPARHIDATLELDVDRAGAQLLLDLGHRPGPLLDPPQPDLGAQRPALPH